MNTLPLWACLWLLQVPPRALVLAMVISYALGFAGMLLAYWNYRKRRRRQSPSKPDEPRP